MSPPQSPKTCAHSLRALLKSLAGRAGPLPADCSLAPTPSRGPGRGEQEGGPRMSAWVPSTPSALPSATHCCHLGGGRRSGPPALACDTGERVAPQSGAARSSFQNWKAGPQGVGISDPQTRHPAAGAGVLLPATQNQGSAPVYPGPQGRRSPERPVPGASAFPLSLRRNEWCAWGYPRPGSLRPGSAQPNLPSPPHTGNEEAPKAASDCRVLGIKDPRWRPV